MGIDTERDSDRLIVEKYKFKKLEQKKFQRIVTHLFH